MREGTISIKRIVRKAESLLVVLLLTSTEVLAGWDSMPPLPEPSGFFASGVVDRKIIVIGGSNWRGGTKHWLDVIWVFDFSTRQWKSQVSLPHALAYPITAKWKDALIIAGGEEHKHPLDEIWRVPSSIQPERIGQLKYDGTLAAAGIIGNDLLIFGGCTDAAEITGIQTGGVRLNLKELKTSKLHTPDDTAFCLAASAVVGRELFTFGGARPDTVAVYKSFSTAWAFDAAKNTWRGLRPYPFAVMGASAVKLDNHRILVGGGYGGKPEDFLKTAFIYDARRDTYTETLDFPYGALIGGLLCYNNVVYCLGGEDKAHRTAAFFSIKVSELLKASH